MERTTLGVIGTRTCSCGYLNLVSSLGVDHTHHFLSILHTYDLWACFRKPVYYSRAALILTLQLAPSDVGCRYFELYHVVSRLLQKGYGIRGYVIPPSVVVIFTPSTRDFLPISI